MGRNLSFSHGEIELEYMKFGTGEKVLLAFHGFGKHAEDYEDDSWTSCKGIDFVGRSEVSEDGSWIEHQHIDASKLLEHGQHDAVINTKP